MKDNVNPLAALFAFLVAGNADALVIGADGNKYVGRITGIRLEDGSGRNWLVKIIGRDKEVFCHAT